MFGHAARIPPCSARRARVAEAPRLHAARTVHDTGWRTEDLMWEMLQERAALACRQGRPEAAPARWDEGLEIAGARFAAGDPRYAASLVNAGVGLAMRGLAHQATRSFDRALLAWSESWRWLADADLPRVEADRLIRGAKARTLTLRRGRPLLAEDGVARWLELRRQPFADIRKLHAAVLLMAPTVDGCADERSELRSERTSA